MLNEIASEGLALLGGNPIRTEPYPQHTTRLGKSERHYLAEVMDSGILSGFAGKFDDRWAGGTMVRKLEEACAERFGSKHAIMFHSGTGAIQATLSAVNIEAGDEVIVSGLCWTTSGSTALALGAIPVFCDVDPITFQMDPTKVKSLITERTRAIYPVNLFGMACDLDGLKAIADDAGIVLLEDNCHAYGMRYKNNQAGTIGLASVISFNYHKIIQCGEGGAALTDDDEIALKLKLIRNHGENIVGPMDRTDLPGQLGWNNRPTELAAAVALGQLEQFDELVTWKQELAEHLTAGLEGHPYLSAPMIPDDREMNYYVYGIRFDAEQAGVHRNTFCEAMKAEGVWVNPGYVNPIYRQPMYQKGAFFGASGFPFVNGISDRDPRELYRDGICPNAESLQDHDLITVIWLKYPYQHSDVDELLVAINKVTKNIKELQEWEKQYIS